MLGVVGLIGCLAGIAFIAFGLSEKEKKILLIGLFTLGFSFLLSGIFIKPINKNQFSYFQQEKEYIESKTDHDFSQEKEELNQWLEENQSKIKFPEWLYFGVPKGLSQETPIES